VTVCLKALGDGHQCLAEHRAPALNAGEMLDDVLGEHDAIAVLLCRAHRSVDRVGEVGCGVQRGEDRGLADLFAAVRVLGRQAIQLGV
jgi:hypothetical protein